MNPPCLHLRFWQRLVLALTLPATIAVGGRNGTTTTLASTGVPMTLRVCFNRESLRGANSNDAMAAYQVFLETIAQEKGYDLQVETEIFTTQADYEAALHRADRPVHLIIIGMWQFLAMDVPDHIEPLFVVADRDTPGRRYVLLTRRDGPLHTLEDLRGLPLLKLELAHNRIADAWLDLTLAEKGLGPPEQFFGPIKISAKPTTTILPVFFGKAPVCLVDEPSLTVMAELNPQVAKTLQRVACSDVLGDVVICLNKQDWPNPTARADTIDAIAHLDTNPAGRQVLTLFKLNRLLPYEPSQCATVRSLRDRWLALNPPPQP